ncbi:MAG: trigger factor, partial [Deltaproteobacteria bacterium]|nr:trigger factor [Deltaproteobacteria bacterium]
MTSDVGFEAASGGGEIRVETEETSTVVRTISIEVAPKRVGKAFDRVYRDLKKNVSLPGFRRGKVPRSVLEKMYGETVPDEIERMLVSETLPDAIELAGVTPLVQPEIEAGRPAIDAPFTYKARVEVRPGIELPELKGLSARTLSTEVSAEEVLVELENLRERSAPLVEEPEETEAAEGHTLTLDYAGTIDGVAFEGGSAEGAELELGGGRFIPGFEEQLVGARSGDDLVVKVDFPEDYGSEELAGKAAEFACHVSAMRKRQLREVDDEFAKDLGDFETLDALRERIRDDLRKQREQSAKSVLHRSVMESLLEGTEFEVPPGIVERQLHGQMDNMRRQFHGQVPEEVLQQQLARIHEEGRSNAERRVKESFLLEAIAEVEKIEASDEELELRLAEMAEQQGMAVEQVTKMAQEQGWLDAIRREVADGKVLDFLASEATVEEVEADEDGAA